jgi:hypothetical protein
MNTNYSTDTKNIRTNYNSDIFQSLCSKIGGRNSACVIRYQLLKDKFPIKLNTNGYDGWICLMEF